MKRTNTKSVTEATTKTTPAKTEKVTEKATKTTKKAATKKGAVKKSQNYVKYIATREDSMSVKETVEMNLRK